jgi:hypothetical protein
VSFEACDDIGLNSDANLLNSWVLDIPSINLLFGLFMNLGWGLFTVSKPVLGFYSICYNKGLNWNSFYV